MGFDGFVKRVNFEVVGIDDGKDAIVVIFISSFRAKRKGKRRGFTGGAGRGDEG